LPGHSLSTLEEADLWIEKNLTDWGYNSHRDETQVRAFGRDFSKPLAHQYAPPPDGAPYYTAHNIIAENKGSVSPGRIIAIIAHKDSQSWISSPGANDNAIGTCAALELARIMKNYNPKHTLMFIFCNEEHTPWTSVTAAKNIKEAGHDVLALINLDAVGGKSADKSGLLINVTRFTTPEGERLADLNKRLNDRFSIGLEQSKYRSENPGDDDGSFIKAGFPWAVLNIGSMPYSDPNYHLETDTPEKVDYDTAEKVVSLTLALILHLDHNGRP
jgi:Zn-dependent M28 family amino/carboxypeptidase